MGSVTNSFVATANVAMLGLFQTLYASARGFANPKFTAFCGGSPNATNSFGKPLTGLIKTTCSDGFADHEQDNYETSEAQMKMHFSITGGDLHLNRQVILGSGSTGSEIIIESAMVDIENLEYSSTWTTSGGGEDWSNLSQGAWYDCANQANTNFYWYWKVYTNASTGHTSREEGALHPNVIVRSKLTGVVLTVLNFECRAKCYSQG